MNSKLNFLNSKYHQFLDSVFFPLHLNEALCEILDLFDVQYRWVNAGCVILRGVPLWSIFGYLKLLISVLLFSIPL